MRCVKTAWHNHQDEIWSFLRQQLGKAEDADDLLQDLYLKALSQGSGFCEIGNPRAWLFNVARNAIVDRHRTSKHHVPLPEDLSAEPAPEQKTVDDLTHCLPRVLSELPERDRQAVLLCDLQGMTQKDYAKHVGLTLPAAKSRLLRARQRLQAQLVVSCKVTFDDYGEVSSFVPRPPLEPQQVG